MSHRFFQNSACECFPCHKTADPEHFNCLFCFCPLYTYANCGGAFSRTPKGHKDCSNCLFPHYNYDAVIEKLKESAQISSSAAEGAASVSSS